MAHMGTLGHGQKRELVDRYLDAELTAGLLQFGAQAGDPPNRQIGLEFCDLPHIQGHQTRGNGLCSGETEQIPTLETQVPFEHAHAER